MYERARLKRESIRYTALFFVLFGLVFAALGVFVYQTVSANVFRTVDEELLENSTQWSSWEGASAALAIESTQRDAADVDAGAVEGDDGNAGDAGGDASGAVALSQSVHLSVKSNPQTIYLTRDRDGEVVDAFGIYADYSDAVKSLPFDTAAQGEVYRVDQDGRHYRAINYRLDPVENGAAYVQVIANVDSEIGILNQFTATLAIGLVVALVLAAALSYLLSRMALRPIADAWERQTEFVQNASHELRTPLAVIRANQELLLDEPAARIVDKFAPVNVTIEEVDRLTRLTDDLLLLTSSDAGSFECAMTPLEAGGLFAGVAEAYEDLAIAQGKALDVQVEGDTMLVGNRDRLTQLAAILLDNALKYTGKGDGVCLSVHGGSGAVELAVSDTGVGVDEADLPHVFDRFYRADKARSRTTGGSGLGLSIAKSIVDAHGGAIRMDRGEPKGVVVTVKLPKRA